MTISISASTETKKDVKETCKIKDWDSGSFRKDLSEEVKFELSSSNKQS